MNVLRKKIIFISSRLPYPANSGRKSVMYNYCKILHEVYGYEIHLISFLENGDLLEPKPKFIHNVTSLNPISTKRKLLNLLKDTFILKKFPMQTALFYDPKHQEYIDKIIKEINPDIVITDMVRTTEYARNYEGYKIADLDDRISIRYNRQMKIDMKLVNPYGAYLYSMPILAQKILSINIIKKIILKNEIVLLQNYERNIAKIYDNTIFVAESEAKELNKELNFNKAIAIPLGVDVKYYGEYYDVIQHKKHTIGFLGAMSVAHNESGVIHFIDNILPYIKEKIPDVKFIIAGGGVTEKLIKKANEHVIFTGYVEDVRKSIGECEVFVCPLTFGSGIKTKNLEAMAMGIPIVTTSIGAENIHAINGQEWLIEDDNELFAEKVIELMNNPKKYSTIRDNAKDFVNKNFTWKVAEEKMAFLKNK